MVDSDSVKQIKLVIDPNADPQEISVVSFRISKDYDLLIEAIKEEVGISSRTEVLRLALVQLAIQLGIIKRRKREYTLIMPETLIRISKRVEQRVERKFKTRMLVHEPEKTQHERGEEQ